MSIKALDYQVVLDFWFEEIEKTAWFWKDEQFDAEIIKRFGDLHAHAANVELMHWRGTAQGRLAEIIVLDQFSRNIYRDSPQAFATDSLALALAQEAVAIHALDELDIDARNFLLMPFMHSESIWVHQVAESLFVNYSNEKTCAFEWKHREIIERFGRYPHRNAILGRESTAQELEFLSQPGSSF